MCETINSFIIKKWCSRSNVFFNIKKSFHINPFYQNLEFNLPTRVVLTENKLQYKGLKYKVVQP